MLLPAGEAGGQEVCVIARALLSVQESSKAFLLAPDDTAATRAVGALERRLDRVASYAARVDRAEATAPDLDGPIARFIESRRRLVTLYRERGLATARAYAIDGEFIAVRQGVREVMRRHPACMAVDREAPDAGGAAAARAPPVADYASKPAVRPVDVRSRAPASQDSVPPPTSVWIGVAVVLVLGLLLFAFVAFDSLDQREDPRFVCHLPTRLRIGKTVERVVIVEISRGGAKLRMPGRFTVGKRGMILVLGMPVAFRVAWVTPTFCGIGFRRKLDSSPAELSRLTGREPGEGERRDAVTAE